MPIRDPEKRRAASRAWKAANKARTKAYDKAYRATNKDHIKDIDAAYYHANRDSLLEYQVAYDRNNRDQKTAYARSRWQRDLKFAGQILTILSLLTDEDAKQEYVDWLHFLADQRGNSRLSHMMSWHGPLYQALSPYTRDGRNDTAGRSG